MKKIIGFATTFYTLWDYEAVPQYVTDSYGKHHQSGVQHKYYYIKNISTDLDKVKILFPKVEIDTELRGTSSFTRNEKIDLHQTVNGQSKFVVLSLYPLDIRYAYDLSKKYEYDSEKLLIPDEYSNVEFEILGSLKISLVIEGEIINTFDYKTITI